MNLKILSLEDALKYEPAVPTYAIRILDWRVKNCSELKKSQNYLIRTYEFDDIKYHSSPATWEGCGECYYSMDDDIASAIINDFSTFFMKGEMDLLVHCRMGKSRSPAAAMSLNRIFDLGFCEEKLRLNFPNYNAFVYNLMIETAKKQGRKV